MSKNALNTDICIVGGGLVGKTAALKLAHTGSDVILCAPKQTFKDQRTTALLMQTVNFFENLNIWEPLQEKAFPLKTMRIIDGTNRLIRSPQTDFNASEIDLDAFGYNLRNADILDVLDKEIASLPNLKILEGTVENIETKGAKENVFVKTQNGDSIIASSFVVGADGRNSIVRNIHNASVREWEYPQSAIVLDFKHERSTQFTSTEFHTQTGPFTIVPHSNHQAGLVWMEKPETVSQLLLLSKQDFALKMESQMQSFLGKITLLNDPQSFPIKGLVANLFGQNNWAIIGEAAHVFPPIGAQGFNLGIRDIECLAEILSRYTNQEDRGGQYNYARKSDINTRTLGVDLLNRSLLSEFLPVQMIRSIGLHVLGSVKPIRKHAMKMGISPNL